MNFLKFLSFILVLSGILSCKKSIDTEPINTELELRPAILDSMSFELDGKQYHFANDYSAGIGNMQTNIKPYADSIPGRKLANETAGKFWYGDKDSTMYTSYFGFISKENASLKIYFNKKYATSEMVKGIFLWLPKDQREIFITGKKSFAIDFEKENRFDGIVLELWNGSSQLSSATPGFSIAVQSHKTDIQNNSTFEITKLEQIEGDKYYIEAEFAMNLFDNQEKLYRIEKGFLKKVVNIVRAPGFFF
jgi:hypothetical protein